jgi:PKD domain/FG-GAP-like repeat
MIDIRSGPAFTASILFNAGKGSNSIAMGDFSGDGVTDIAVANYYDKSILVFFQPFSLGSPPDYNLSMSGSPLSLTAGRLNSDTYDDIAAVTENPSSLLFFFQSLGNLETIPDVTYSRDLPWESPDSVWSTDLDGDNRTDLAMLSSDMNLAFGIYQRASGDIWPDALDFMFPTGATPRHVLAGDLDSDSNIDLAISSARSDWSGSSLAIYPSRYPTSPLFSNSNRTYLGNLTFEASEISSGDMDGDGTGELVLLYPSDDAIEIIKTSTGQGYNKSLGFTPSRMLISDTNGDGFDDILLSGVDSSDLMLGLGSSDLSAPMMFMSLSCGANVTAISFGDFNNDSRTDVIASTVDGRLDIFLNDDNLTVPFGLPLEIVPAPGTMIPALAVGDFNDDGLDDVAYSLPSLKINISFQKTTYPYILAAADIELFDAGTETFASLWAGDLTDDGKTDIAAMRSSDSSIIFFDQDDFNTSRSPYRQFSLPDSPSFVSVVDATDDGLSDILVTFASADLMFLYRQAAGIMPAEPSMIFVTGAMPNWVALGEVGSGHKHALICSDSQSHAVSIWEQVNLPPVAEAGGPYSGTEGIPIQLTGSATDAVSQMAGLEYRWEFGDGNSTGWSSSPVAEHAYELESSYVATFDVRDPEGKLGSDTASVTVADSLPVADFYWSPVPPLEGVDIVFTENVSTTDELVLINWTIDGLQVSSGLNHSMTWTFQNGTFQVALEVTDIDGSVANVTKTIVVGRSAPQVKISGPLSATEDDIVTFFASVDPWHSGVGDSIVNYDWNFSYTGTFVSNRLTAWDNTTWVFSTSTDVTEYEIVVKATDNDGDQGYGFFNITIFDRTKVTLELSDPGPYYEYGEVNLTAIVDSSHPATLFEWMFDGNPSDPFVPEAISLTEDYTTSYNTPNNWYVRVRVTVSNGSSAIGSIFVPVEDVVPQGTFDEFVTWSRNPNVTSEITFNGSLLSQRYPDIAATFWEFGDGNITSNFGGPGVVPTVHKYDPVRDYTFILNVTDDEGTTLLLNKTFKLSEPSILLTSPAGDLVMRSGTPIQLLISDDSPPLLWVMYSVNRGPMSEFASQWQIATSDWIDGDYSLVVKAADKDGNIAVRDNITITVDDQPPLVEVLWIVKSVYGGSTVNITVNVTEPHIDASEIIIFVKVPGTESYSQIRMNHYSGSTYYALVEIPKRPGTMLFHLNATDLAGNSADTEPFSVTVKLKFIDAAWPYLLASALLATLGTAGYFVREVKIAVDETFVIYNDGRLIAHSTRNLKPGMDDQVLGGMLAAIQDFVKDSFKDVTSFTLRKLEFGEKSVLIEKGDHLFLAVILHGKASRKVASKMERIVDEIEETFSPKLMEWDGDLDALRGVSDIAKKLYSKAPLLPSYRKPDN